MLEVDVALLQDGVQVVVELGAAAAAAGPAPAPAVPPAPVETVDYR